MTLTAFLRTPSRQRIRQRRAVASWRAGPGGRVGWRRDAHVM